MKEGRRRKKGEEAKMKKWEKRQEGRKEARSISIQPVRQEGNKSGSTVNDFSRAIHLLRCFTSTKTVLRFRDGSPGRPSPLSHSS